MQSVKHIGVTRFGFLLVLAVCGALAAFSPASPAAAGNKPAIDVGGPFSLVDHTGKPVSEQDYHGRFLLVFFGFTYCPDICPTELQEISAVLDRLGDDAARVAPLFITVDPERDTPDVMAEYIGNFHPGIVGLTGSPEQIESVARAYRVYYAKAGNGDSYLVDHSAVIYLMGPDGRYLTHFSRTASPTEMAETIRRYLSGAGS